MRIYQTRNGVVHFQYKPVARMTATEYSWNVFRYVGDYLHLFSILVVIGTLAKNRHCRGLSFKTQLFYLIIFCTRYLDMFTMGSHGSHSGYLYAFKIFYIVSAAAIVFTMRRWAATIETNKDTCSYLFVIGPCLIAAMVSILTSSTKSATLFFWMFSEFLEAFAMLPQYIFTYRQDAENKRADNGVFVFICLVGSYRVLYAINWIYKKIMLGSAYTDTVSWIGGVIEILLFADFMLNREFLKLVVLTVDSKINELTSAIELNVLRKNQGPLGSLSPSGVRNRKTTTLDNEEDEAMLMI